MDSFPRYVPFKQILMINDICCAKFIFEGLLWPRRCRDLPKPDLLIPLAIQPVSQKAHKAKVPRAQPDRCVRAFQSTREGGGTGRNQTAIQ